LRKFLLLFALTAGLICYLNAFRNDFVWDDQALILENPNVQQPNGFKAFFNGSIAEGSPRESPYFRPLYMLSFWLDYQIWGAHPLGFHLTNLIFHLLNVWLLFQLISHLSIRTGSAFFASIFFAVHPALTESVTSISGRGWLIAGFFLLSALLCFVTYREGMMRKNRGWFLAACLFFLLALLAMEIAMVFPLLVLLYDSMNRLSEKRHWKQLFLPHAILWVLLAVFLFLRMFAAGSGWFSYGSLHFDRRLLTAPLLFWNYLGILLFPGTLRLERTIPFARTLADPRALAAWAGILVAAGLIFYLLRKRRAGLFVFGVLWMTICFIPTLNVVPLRAMMAEAWLYLPCMGFCMAVSALLMKGMERFPRGVGGMAAIWLILLSARTLVRNTDWRDPLTLYRESVKASPDSIKMQYNLAVTYSGLGEYGLSEKEFEKIRTDRARYMRDFNRNFYQD